jgi:hypothetical protein
VDNTEHRRRSIRRWLCTCGRRFPCGTYLNRRDQASRHAHRGGPVAATLVGWSIGRPQPVTGGVTIVGGEIRIDTKAVYYLHDVDRNPDPENGNCPICGEDYPCDLVDAVGRLEEALKPWRDKTTVPTGAASEME